MCAWCGRKIPGIHPNSHGICSSCMGKILREFKEAENNKEK